MYFCSRDETLTSESTPLSAPGHLNVTYSWQRLWTTNEQTVDAARRWGKALEIGLETTRHHHRNWNPIQLTLVANNNTLTLKSLFAETPKLMVRKKREMLERIFIYCSSEKYSFFTSLYERHISPETTRLDGEIFPSQASFQLSDPLMKTFF